jgi:hypothetical protein
MELRSLRITLYVGALTLIACGSSNTNSSPFENATNSNVKQDASSGNGSSSSGGGGGGSNSSGGSASSSSGGTDTTGTAATCKTDSDCNGGCCDPSALTCFTPEGGQCPGASGGDDGGSSGDDGGMPPI